MKDERNLETAQKLMLVQGIGLINEGLQLIEWAEGFPNELSFDLYEILIERFKSFQQCVLDGKQDHLIIDRVKRYMVGIKHAHELNEKIQKQLQELREQVMAERNQKKKDTE